MSYKDYLIYFDKEDIDVSTKKGELEQLFNKRNVCQLKNSTSFAIKVSEEKSLSDVLEELKMTSAGNIRGMAMEILPGHRNGWYSADFWEFLKQPIHMSGQE